MSDVDRDRETTIIETGDRGSGGTILAVVVLIAALALLFYMFGDRLTGGGDKTDVKVDVGTPAIPTEG